MRLNRSSSVGRDRQREDVEAPPGEQPGDPGEHAGLVLARGPTGCGGCVVGHAQRAPSRICESGEDDVVVAHARPAPSGTPSRGRRCGSRSTTGRSSIALALSMAGCDLFGRLDPDADAAHRLGPLHVVGQVGRQVDLAVALLVEHLLPLADHAEVAVVEDRDLDRDALGAGGDQLLRGHLEAAVAVDGPHRAVGPADLGADGGRHAEAHRAEAAGVDPRVGLVELPVLADVHIWCWPTPLTQDRVLGRVVAQLLEAELRLQRLARLARLVGQRELLPPAADAALPRRRCRPASRRRPAGRGSP